MRGKSGQVSIGVPHNFKGEVLSMFFNDVGVKESNELEVMATLESLQILSSFFQDKLIVERDSANVVLWALHNN